jgi:hypothetical protein
MSAQLITVYKFGWIGNSTTQYNVIYQPPDGAIAVFTYAAVNVHPGKRPTGTVFQPSVWMWVQRIAVPSFQGQGDGYTLARNLQVKLDQTNNNAVGGPSSSATAPGPFTPWPGVIQIASNMNVRVQFKGLDIDTADYELYGYLIPQPLT